MSLNVSLPSSRSRNEWFLIARMRVSCRIRVMKTAKYSQAEMNDSSNSTTQIIVGSDTEIHSPRAGQRQNAGSRFRGTRTMQYTPVSCGTGHSFRDTRTIPYAYWDSECQREREYQHQERTPSGVVSWTERVESEWMKKFERGPRPTKGRSRTKSKFRTMQLSMRDRDEQIKQERLIKYSEMRFCEALGRRGCRKGSNHRESRWPNDGRNGWWVYLLCQETPAQTAYRILVPQCPKEMTRRMETNVLFQGNKNTTEMITMDRW